MPETFAADRRRGTLPPLVPRERRKRGIERSPSRARNDGRVFLSYQLRRCEDFVRWLCTRGGLVVTIVLRKDATDTRAMLPKRGSLSCRCSIPYRVEQMLRILGRKQRLCDGIARRDFLRVGGLGALGISWPALLHASSSWGGDWTFVVVAD